MSMYLCLIIILGILLTISVWRKFHQDYSELRFRLKMYEIRDGLRMEAINGNIDASHWLFQYWDSTFSVVIRESYFQTLFNLIVKVSIASNDKNFEKMVNTVKRSSNEHPEFQPFINQFNSTIQEYIVSQHMLSFKLIGGIKAIFNLKLPKRIRNFISTIVFLPGTASSNKVQVPLNLVPC